MKKTNQNNMLDELKFDKKTEKVEFVILKKFQRIINLKIQTTTYEAVSLHIDFYNNEYHLNSFSRGIRTFEDSEIDQLIEELEKNKIPYKKLNF